MSTPGSPKAGCEWYAAMCGWTLAAGNVMVEGTSDVAYFELAAKLHKAHCGMSLLGADFSIFAAGLEQEGGTYGICERFPTLFNLAVYDRDSEERRRFRVIALLDDDTMGQSAMGLITTGHRQIREYQSIFRLRRLMLQSLDSAGTLRTQTEAANAKFGRLECTIEDMLSDELCERFLTLRPEAMSRQPASTGTGTHRHWTVPGKALLREFAERNAAIQDVQLLTQALRALRSYVGLPPDGVRK